MTVNETIAKAINEFGNILPKIMEKDRASLASRGLTGVDLDRTMQFHEIVCYERALAAVIAGMREELERGGPIDYPFKTGEGQPRH